MEDLGVLKNIETIRKFPVSRVCRDGRKVPEGIDLNKFFKMDNYLWRNSEECNDILFTYSPFLVNPVDAKSILDIVDPKEERFSGRKLRKNVTYHLPRIFEASGKIIDPLNARREIVVFDGERNDEIFYFQTNVFVSDDSSTYIIETTKDKLAGMLEYFCGHEIFFGEIKPKIRC